MKFKRDNCFTNFEWHNNRKKNENRIPSVPLKVDDSFI